MRVLKLSYEHRIFHFRKPSGTSRGVLTEKHSWLLNVWYPDDPETIGIGECSVIPGLTPDYKDNAAYETVLDELCRNPAMDLTAYPSILFGLESALLDLQNGGIQVYFNNTFSRGERKIPINGLIWMGSEAEMQTQIEEKLESGFTTIKMKIGAISFDQEISLLRSIRSKFTKNEINLRVDANGAFTADEATAKLQILSELGIHSIEQPIAAGQWEDLRRLVNLHLVDIALDEELIGIHERAEKIRLLETIRPPYIILKPSLHGGISGTKEWIDLAEERGIRWWMTSALESNIGLNAICQFCGEYENELPQGLGTGSLYTDNIQSDLIVENGYIRLSND